MRHLLIFTSFLILATNLLAQKNEKKQGKSSQGDTPYTLVRLRDILYNKTLIIEVGEKASIYLSGDSIINEATKNLSGDLVKEEYNRIISFLDSAFKQGDTVAIRFDELTHQTYLFCNHIIH